LIKAKELAQARDILTSLSSNWATVQSESPSLDELEVFVTKENALLVSSQVMGEEERGVFLTEAMQLLSLWKLGQRDQTAFLRHRLQQVYTCAHSGDAGAAVDSLRQLQALFSVQPLTTFQQLGTDERYR
jgi:hypothetical protein